MSLETDHRMHETATQQIVRPPAARASRSLLADEAIQSDVDAQWTEVRSGPEGFVYVKGLAALPALIKERARNLGIDIADPKAQQAAGLLLVLAVLVVDRNHRLRAHQRSGRLDGHVWSGGYWPDIPGYTKQSADTFGQLRDLLGDIGLLELRPATQMEGGDGRRLHGLTKTAADALLVPGGASLPTGAVPLQRHALRHLGVRLAKHSTGVDCVLRLWRIVSLLDPVGPGLDDLGFLEATTSQLADRWHCKSRSARSTRDLLLKVDGVHRAPEPRANAVTPRSLQGRRLKLHDALDLVCELTGRQIRFAPARAPSPDGGHGVPCCKTAPCPCATPPPNNAHNATKRNPSGAGGASRTHSPPAAASRTHDTGWRNLGAAYSDETTVSPSYTAAAIRFLERNRAEVERWAQTASGSIRGAVDKLLRLATDAGRRKAALADGVIELTDQQRQLDAAVARLLRALAHHHDDIHTSVAFADLDTAVPPLEFISKIGARIRKFANTAPRRDSEVDAVLKRIREAFTPKTMIAATPPAVTRGRPTHTTAQR